MEIIHDIPHKHLPENAIAITLLASRATLAKRRWRGVAEDGREFGFDLDHGLEHGHLFFSENGKHYVAMQEAESVLEIPLADDAARAASLAWQIGNLHFPIEITDTLIRTIDDPAMTGMLERAGIPFTRNQALFFPAIGSPHGHHHH